jgi:hypothetical protein
MNIKIIALTVQQSKKGDREDIDKKGGRPSMKYFSLFGSFFLWIATYLARSLTPFHNVMAHLVPPLVGSVKPINNASAATLLAATSYDIAVMDDEKDDEDTCTDMYSLQWSKKNVSEVLQSWKWNKTQQDHFIDLQQRLSDIKHWRNNPAEVARFLSEHNFDVNKAVHMFRAMIQWRIENNIDNFMERYGQPPEVFHFWPSSPLKGLDKEMDPILFQSLGKADAWGLYKYMGGEEMLKAHIFLNEVLTCRDMGIPQHLRWQTNYYEPFAAGKRFTQFTIIVDLQGLGPRMLHPSLISLLQETSRIAQDYYPGMAKQCIFIRAPRIFRMAWSIAKHFYDDRVHDRFVFSNHDNYLQVLSNYVDLEVLPPFLYPRGKGETMPGFFQKIHLEGLKIPALPMD